MDATAIDLSPGHRDQVTVSIGLAVWPTDADDRVKLLEGADAALCRAKNSGRNRVVVAGEEFTGRGASSGTTGGAPAGEAPPDDTSVGADLVPQPIALHRAG